MHTQGIEQQQVAGEFVTLEHERAYKISHTETMDPFFISLVSSSDHWLFISSTGGLSAGRISPEYALFPYITVDKIHESHLHTGSKTIIKVQCKGKNWQWQPFNTQQQQFNIERNIYKNTLGNKLCLEEINHDLQLTFKYSWLTSDTYGFIRQAEIINHNNRQVDIDIIDGLQNILPANTPRFTQANASNLIDAYKVQELIEQGPLAVYSLYSAISDRAQPAESLKANTVFCVGLDISHTLLSSAQLAAFIKQQPLHTEKMQRGVRGAYLVNSQFTLAAGTQKQWHIVANLQQSQVQVSQLQQALQQPVLLKTSLLQSEHNDADELAKIMANADAFQLTNQEQVSVHHYANVMFNVLRGGIFDQQYFIDSQDFSRNIKHFNHSVFLRHQTLLTELPDTIIYPALLSNVIATEDKQLIRLCYEYLPICFGRRHGDPSRPWNQFAINVKDENQQRILSYQGNWRDIFQNWEALCFSYPEFIESVICKFVNASTIDGYNPYRITKEGIDWEVEEADNPWSNIGYWGDHQIIYLLKLLEQSQQFHPQKLQQMLHQPWFSYANVPYKIKPFSDIVSDAKNTITYDHYKAKQIDDIVAKIGADGKLILDSQQQVYQVNLIEKLLVTLLCKLSNFVIDGGIWLNSQRPEWNDANNALVGQGLSMVTLYYLRRYISFLQPLFAEAGEQVQLSYEVGQWLTDSAKIYNQLQQQLADTTSNALLIDDYLAQLGQAASNYRQQVYAQSGFSGQSKVAMAPLNQLLTDALTCIDNTITHNLSSNGLYHAYNLLKLNDKQTQIEHLYSMLEGQVAILSRGALSALECNNVLAALFASNMYRADQQSFMLYADREVTSFLDKNQVSAVLVHDDALLSQLVKQKNIQIIEQDCNGIYRFNSQFSNQDDLIKALQNLPMAVTPDQQQQVLAIYEQVFNHNAFTGRSNGMFGFEGLGCIYWHMVAKLLLAVAENYFTAIEANASTEQIKSLGQYYYLIRQGIGFNKTPSEYGAFPCDPYSHTPKHAGAQQPGMTGQVKEEVLSRFLELGIRVKQGQVHLNPALLSKDELLAHAWKFDYLDVNQQWQQISVQANGLAFTWCQLPIIYQLRDDLSPHIMIYFADGSHTKINHMQLSQAHSQSIFNRSGEIKQLTVILSSAQLYNKY